MEASTNSSQLHLPRRPIDRMLSPVRGFLSHRLAGAALLILAAIAAIVIANSPLGHAYHELLELHIDIDLGLHGVNQTLHHWINDGLMSIFFFLVGLEIKRELLVGEISSVRKATLPAIAALGGMVVPALVYHWFNRDTPNQHGWGIPMATDIAFALGVLALLGDRIPAGAKVFLTALAIVDDIGAVVVIAVFYTNDVNLTALGVGFAFLAGGVLLNRLGVRHPVPYLAVGMVTWLAFLESGIHATIAAILMAFIIPATTRIDGADLMRRIELLSARLHDVGLPRGKHMNTAEQQQALLALAETVEYAQAPLQRIEHDLHGFVTFLVLPVFALANAGVTLEGDLVEQLQHPLALGVILGLFVGKQVGITLSTWLAVRLRVADLPGGVNWRQIHGVAILGGIGFTMSLFVAGLAFSDPHQVDAGKMGIMCGSLLSAVVGVAFLLVGGSRETAQ